MPRPRNAGIISTVLLALLPRRLELIALLPTNQLRQTRGLPPQRKSKPRHRRVPHKIHLRMVLIARLVIMFLHVLALLLESPSLVVPLVFHPFVDRKCRNPYPRQA